MELKQQIYQNLRNQGCRITAHKRSLIEMLINNLGRFLSITDLENLIPDSVSMDTSTIYRTVMTLQEHGLIESMIDDNGLTSYMLCHELGVHHHHLICTGCGKTIIIPCQPQLWQDASQQCQFLVTHHKVEIYGLCADCQARGLKS
jgi:Fe2+ or Zn2+ uptake regulation protein